MRLIGFDKRKWLKPFIIKKKVLKNISYIPVIFQFYLFPLILKSKKVIGFKTINVFTFFMCACACYYNHWLMQTISILYVAVAIKGHDDVTFSNTLEKGCYSIIRTSVLHVIYHSGYAQISNLILNEKPPFRSDQQLWKLLICFLILKDRSEWNVWPKRGEKHLKHKICMETLHKYNSTCKNML